MIAQRVIYYFRDLLDIKVTRAAPTWLRLDAGTPGTVSERTAAQTLGDIGAVPLNGNAGTPSAIVLTNASGNAANLSVNFAVSSLYSDTTGMAGGVLRSGLITALLSDPLPITSGGTGGDTAGAARTELGIPDPPVSKTATSDVTVSNQAGALTDSARNDAQLSQFPVDANSTYRVTIYFEYSSTTTLAGIKIGVNFPSLAGNGAQRGGIGTTPSGAIVNIPHVAGALFQLTSPLGGTRVQITATIIARTGVTGGVGDFRWAQVTPIADPTTRHAGSSITFEKIA